MLLVWDARDVGFTLRGAIFWRLDLVFFALQLLLKMTRERVSMHTLFAL